MSQTAPTAITALSAAPATTSPSTFATLADAFVAALATLVSQTNSVSTVNYNNAVDAYNNAVSAAANAVSAIAAAGAIKWVSGTTYVIGDARWSPVNNQSYRRITNGAGTTDPSLDKTNWTLIGPASAVVPINLQLFGAFK